MKVCLVEVVFRERGIEKKKFEFAKADTPEVAVQKVRAKYALLELPLKECRSREPQELVE